MPNYATRFLGSTATYAPTWTATDLSITKGQVVKCYSPDGSFVDVIRDAPYLTGFKENINADALRVTLPRAVDAYDGEFQPGSKGTIALGNILQWWLWRLWHHNRPKWRNSHCE